jgi:sterol desaturase/sphingolipid hydroxylase (fatty acid hydroxylase superfamily)
MILAATLNAPAFVVPLGFFAVALVFIAAEYAYQRLGQHADDHDLAETTASVWIAVGDIVSRLLTGSIAAVPFFVLYQYRVFDIPIDRASSLIALFLGVEFCYYWFHRASHRIRWLWATHAVHHSATHFNLSATIRLGWTGQLSGAFIFFLPLAALGFHPLAISLTVLLGLMYQFFLHTSLPVTLGPLEWVLNSPAHHRVHHASNVSCLDTNYGSVLIIWDRLFGTFARAPDEPMKFGLEGREPTNRVIDIAFGEWRRLFADLSRAPDWRARWAVVFGPP